jgi:hypothetical protein
MHVSELVLTAPVIGQWSPLPLSMTKRLDTSDRTSMQVVEGWLKCTWRNAATAVSDVRFYDDRYIRCVFLAGG